MSYTPTEWTCGDVVTAEALNKIEQGILSASSSDSDVFIVNYDYSTIDKTFAEITQAINDGKVVLVKLTYGQMTTYLRLVRVESTSIGFSAVVPSMVFGSGVTTAINNAILYALDITSSDAVEVATKNITLA